jgi:hypothetical protein
MLANDSGVYEKKKAYFAMAPPMSASSLKRTRHGFAMTGRMRRSSDVEHPLVLDNRQIDRSCRALASGMAALTPLTEIPQGCSSKFLTLGRV